MVRPGCNLGPKFPPHVGRSPKTIWQQFRPYKKKSMTNPTQLNSSSLSTHQCDRYLTHIIWEWGRKVTITKFQFTKLNIWCLPEKDIGWFSKAWSFSFRSTKNTLISKYPNIMFIQVFGYLKKVVSTHLYWKWMDR